MKFRFIIPIFNQRLTKWSLGFLVASFLFNVFNYLFTVTMGRMLSVTAFGALNATWAVFLLLSSMPSGTLGTLVTRLTGTLFGRKDWTGIHQLVTVWYRWVLFGSIPVSVGIIGASLLFHLPRWPVAVFLALALPIAFLTALTGSVLQGTQRFGWNIAGTITQPMVKLATAVLLVALGFGLGGAYVGILVSFFTAHILTLIPLRDSFRWNTGSVVSADRAWADLLPVVSATIGMTMLATLDMIAVKQLFSAPSVGLYAAALTAGRVVYYIPTPIVSVLFPLLTARHAQNGRYLRLFKYGALFVTGSAVVVALAQILFPRVWMYALFFFSAKYLAAAPLLPFLAIQMVIGALIHVFVHFFLATKLSNAMLLFPVGAVLPFALYLVYHPSLEVIILETIVGSGVVLIGLVVAFIRVERNAVVHMLAALKECKTKNEKRKTTV